MRSTTGSHRRGTFLRSGRPGPGLLGRGLLLSAVLLLGVALVAAGCEIGRTEVAPRQVAGGDPDRGREELRRYGCGACHFVPGVDGATGRVAPPLTAFADRGFVAGVLPNNADELIRWIQDPPSVNPQTAMPDLGVTEEDARHMAAYLYTLR
jgi:cytochrome c